MITDRNVSQCLKRKISYYENHFSVFLKRMFCYFPSLFLKQMTSIFYVSCHLWFVYMSENMNGMGQKSEALVGWYVMVWHLKHFYFLILHLVY